ncbi:hypothetical protein POM88_037094 [Heracleum sosnowskyi]|uniref:NAC domain-containing protein n=1 Tax=Heracleum sosnowskyi TaxID=360622 RepID=A0AAD8HPH5_9APIA|nr:hypothetical protein POM88_037094 [Heracleum sosnowskyi]
MVEAIKKISYYVSQLRRVGKGHGVWHFDQSLLLEGCSRLLVFIPTLDTENGICYTNPENLPGAKEDGTSVYFFHKTANAYATGQMKRWKIQNENSSARSMCAGIRYARQNLYWRMESRRAVRKSWFYTEVQ